MKAFALFYAHTLTGCLFLAIGATAVGKAFDNVVTQADCNRHNGRALGLDCRGCVVDAGVVDEAGHGASGLRKV